MYIELSSQEISSVQQAADATCCFCFFGIGLRLSSDHPETLEIFKTIHRNFIVSHLLQTDFTCYIISKAASPYSPAVVMGNLLYRLPQDEDFLSWAELIMFQSIMEAVGNRLILHAGVVAKNGSASIIYAPSGYGKTTLVLELVSRGFSFFSDEYCVTALPGHTVMPFPRMVGLRSDNPFFLSIKQSGRPWVKYENKFFVDCYDMFPHSRASECRARNLIVLTDRIPQRAEDAQKETVVDVVMFRENDMLLHELSRHAEVQVVNNVLRGFYTGYRIKVSSTAPVANVLQNVWKKYQKDIFCVGVLSDNKPNFSTAPALERMSKAETLFEVLTHLMNRAPTGMLMQRYNGRITGLLMEIGGFINEVNCYRMKPGPLREMSEMIESIT